MGHYELISACFFWKISSKKKHFFEVGTPKFADPPPPFFAQCLNFFVLICPLCYDSHNLAQAKISFSTNERAGLMTTDQLQAKKLETCSKPSKSNVIRKDCI